jgi:hypothetical protein
VITEAGFPITIVGFSIKKEFKGNWLVEKKCQNLFSF